MISLFEIAQNINEADDDKYVSIGYGRYKEKGKEKDDDADVYVKTDSGKYVKSSDQKSDDDGGKPEEPKGKSLGKGDFERDFDNDANRAADDEADDMDRDARFAADAEDDDDREEDPNYLFKQDDDDDEDENKVADANSDVIRSLEDMDLNGLDINSVSSETDEGMYAELMGKDVDEPDNAMTVTAFEEGGKIEYGINVGIGHEVIYFDSKEEALKATQKLAKDDKIRKAMDGEGEETLADLGDHAKSIVKGKDETITINGKKYKPIKESKKNPQLFKEIYERTFRSLK
jgi:hypothetical protein